MEVQFFVCFTVFIPALHYSLPYFSIDISFLFICLLPRLVLTTATLRRRSRLWREYAFYPVMIPNGMTLSRFGVPVEGSSGTTSAWRRTRSLSRLVLVHWMTPKLSSCYRKSSLNAAVLTQQQPLLSGVAHCQTQAGNTNASPQQRARSKVHVTLETVVPSQPSALHRKDRTLPAWQRRAQRPASLARGLRLGLLFSMELGQLCRCGWRRRMGGLVGTQRPFWLIFTVCGLFICSLFLEAATLTFSVTRLNLVWSLCSLATCKSCAIQLTVNAHEESRAASLLAPGHRSTPSHSSTSSTLWGFVLRSLWHETGLGIDGIYIGAQEDTDTASGHLIKA